MKKRPYIQALLLLWVSQNVAADNLISLYNKALLADPTLKAAQYKVAVGQAQQAQTGGALLPQISANVNMSLNNRDTTGFSKDGYKGQRYNVRLSQTVIDFPKYWNWDRAKNVSKQYQAEMREAEQKLILDVVDRYFTTLEERDNLFLIQQEKKSTQTQLQQLKQQFKKKIIKITDVLEIEARLNGLQADEIDAETRYIIAQESLVELTGEKIGVLDELKPDIEYTPIDSGIEHWIEQAKTLNPALQAKRQSIAAAASDVSQQQAKHLPTVDLQLIYYFSNTGFQSARQPESNTEVAALNMNIPIFSGGSTHQRANEAAQKLEIAKQENISTLRMVIKQTRDAYLSTNASLKRIKAAQKALESSSKSRDAMEKGFKYGVQTISDVLISQSREFRAKRDLLQAKYSYIKNRINFARVTGMINQQSLQEINHWLVPPKQKGNTPVS